MASVMIADEGRKLDSYEAVQQYLAQHGIEYERWDLDRLVSEDATNEEILEAYAPEIERLKAEGGYVTADVINVTPDTPNLDAMLDKFNKEHTHSEDEVRFCVEGRGTFHVRPRQADGTPSTVFAIEMEAGDWISVPAGTHHWFDLCSERTIRAIRLFQDTSGWTPHYTGDTVHEQYAPVCWGPAYVEAGGFRPSFDPTASSSN